MQERSVCGRCKVPQLYGLAMDSCTGTMELTDKYTVSRSPALLRMGRDLYGLFYNSYTLLWDMVEEPKFQCPDCPYVEKLNNGDEGEG